jgi:excisionase family DNA binding protein
MRQGLVRFGAAPAFEASAAIVARLEHLLGVLDELESQRAWIEEALVMARCSLPVAVDPREEPSSGSDGEVSTSALHGMNTVAEVARFARVSTRTVQRAIADGELSTVRVGAGPRRPHRIPDQAVWDWLNTHGG